MDIECGHSWYMVGRCAPRNMVDSDGSQGPARNVRGGAYATSAADASPEADVSRAKLSPIVGR